MDNYSEGLASGLAIGQGNNCGSGYGGFGGYGWGADWIWVILLLALFGNNGWGFGGNQGGCGCGCGWGGNAIGYELGKVATSNDVAVGFAQNATLNSLNDLKLGQAGIQQTLCQGFGGINTAIAQNGYETRLAVNDLGYRLQDCCCQTQRAIDGVNYNLATQSCDIKNTIQSTTRDIIDAQRDGTNAILNFLTQDKIATLQAENQSLKFQASQTAQNAYLTATIDAGNAELIRRLGRDCPVPAYIVPNPACCYTPNFTSGCGCNSGCGCGI